MTSYEFTEEQISGLALRIARGIQPRSVLLVDVGAPGLVSVLQAAGIRVAEENWAGLDESASAPEPIASPASRFDLAVWRPIAPATQLAAGRMVFAARAEQTVAALCAAANDALVIYDGDPLEINSPSLARADLTALFAMRGFARQLRFALADSPTGHLLRYTRTATTPAGQAADYENALQTVELETRARHSLMLDQQRAVLRLHADLNSAERALTQQTQEATELGVRASGQARALEASRTEIAILRERSSQLESKVVESKDALAERADELARLQVKLKEHEERLEGARGDNARLEAALSRRLEQLRQAETQIAALSSTISTHEAEQRRLKQTVGWTMLARMQSLRGRVSPPGSRRDQLLEHALTVVWLLRKRGARAAAGYIRNPSHRPGSQPSNGLASVSARGTSVVVSPVNPPQPPTDRQPLTTATVVVCVHNALDDVRACLESVTRHTANRHALVVVDDGSDAPTRDFLIDFARQHPMDLVRNDTATGYTRAANCGLQRAQNDCIVFLNSDTIVSADWLERMIACANSSPDIGLVGPLSNTASWQSVPEIERLGDWAVNPLPTGVTIDDMARLVAKYSGQVRPRLPFLNGFCLLIRRDVVAQIGPFDEEAFGAGYGEEDDYLLRAAAAGWQAAVADDVYVHHAQSRSYSTERRLELYKASAAALAKTHGQKKIDEGVAGCRDSRPMAGIRARVAVIAEREAAIEAGRRDFAGKRLLIVLPVADPGGGANVVLSESRAMRRMGVDARIFNLAANCLSFSRAYSSIDVPIEYGTVDDIARLAPEFDAVCATANYSVEWLRPVEREAAARPLLGYYIQGFEPLMFPDDPEPRRRALESYTMLGNAVLFCKTSWNRDMVAGHTGRVPTIIGASFEIDLFRPRQRQGSRNADQVTIAAMIRPESPYRSPQLTMAVLKQIADRHGERVRVLLFGTTPENDGFRQLPRDFEWELAGILSPSQTTEILNDADIFVDFSSHQAMGLTAMEAMGCGCAVIVPAEGGARTFAVDGVNSLVVDTASKQDCFEALESLIIRPDLRSNLQANAIRSVCEFHPERAALNILRALFAGSASKLADAS